MENKIMDIWKVSNPLVAQAKAYKYLGKDAHIYISDRRDKKYYIIDPRTNKKIHFGSTLSDYTKHKDDERRQRYLSRSSKIKGNWKDNPYSPNNLSRHILW
jgi:hypothetical protein